MRNMLVFLCSCAIVLSTSCERESKYSSIYPIALINEAVAIYPESMDYNDPMVRYGRLAGEVLIADSVYLNSEQWDSVIDIATSPLSDADSVEGCFYPSFYVIFYGGYHQYVGHLTVSLDCNQLKYTDNSGILILNKSQKGRFEQWFEEVFSTKYIGFLERRYVEDKK